MTLVGQSGNWTAARNGIGVSCRASTMTLDALTIDDNSQYAVYCDDSTVAIDSCYLTGVNGVYASATNDNLNLSSTRLSTTTAGGWGATRYGGNIDIKNCVFAGFSNGIYLSTSGSEVAEITNSTVAGVTTDGIVLADGSATVAS
jgi:hypothetical protein